jgi:hypothetical protein
VVSGARRRRPRLGLCAVLQEREAPIVEMKAGWADRLLSHGLNRKGGRNRRQPRLVGRLGHRQATQLGSRAAFP